jgi:hypothetical protein
MTTRPFTSPLKEELERFLQYKRAVGCRYRDEERALGCLDRFLAGYLAAKEPVITLDVVRAYVAQEGPEVIPAFRRRSDVRSTEVYVQTDLEAKRKALEQAGTLSQDTRRARRIAPDLLKWLESL